MIKKPATWVLVKFFKITKLLQLKYPADFRKSSVKSILKDVINADEKLHKFFKLTKMLFFRETDNEILDGTEKSWICEKT